MIYLKEFNTTAEYEAFVESGQMKRPNVSLVNEPFTTYYNKYIPLGVFIQHIDGTLYTEADWTSGGFSNDEANGVAVSTENARFVIAKTSFKNKVWSSDTNTLVSGILTTTSKIEAYTDVKGYGNTQLMLATDTSGAAYACANYIFPNGEKGYLPAYGELHEASLNVDKINSAMSIIGGVTYSFSGYSWSSTQYSNDSAWCYSVSSVSKGFDTKNRDYSINIFVFLKLEI